MERSRLACIIRPRAAAGGCRRNRRWYLWASLALNQHGRNDAGPVLRQRGHGNDHCWRPTNEMPSWAVFDGPGWLRPSAGYAIFGFCEEQIVVGWTAGRPPIDRSLGTVQRPVIETPYARIPMPIGGWMKSAQWGCPITQGDFPVLTLAFPQAGNLVCDVHQGSIEPAPAGTASAKVYDGQPSRSGAFRSSPGRVLSSLDEWERSPHRLMDHRSHPGVVRAKPRRFCVANGS